MWLYFRFSSERAKLNCVTHSVKFEYWYLKKLSMIRNKVVWDKHYNSNRLTERNIFLFCYSRFRLMCIFKHVFTVIWWYRMYIHNAKYPEKLAKLGILIYIVQAFSFFVNTSYIMIICKPTTKLHTSDNNTRLYDGESKSSTSWHRFQLSDVRIPVSPLRFRIFFVISCFQVA